MPVLNVAAIVLATKFFDVLMHTGEMTSQCLFTTVFIVSLHIIQEGSKRNFGINDHILIIGIMQHYIGNHLAACFLMEKQVSTIVTQGSLNIIMDTFFQSLIL